MEKVILNKTEVEFIVDLLKSELANKYFDSKFVLQEQVAEELADILSDKLCEIGLNENDEPNEKGYLIEDLIDKCTRAIYK